MTKTVLLDNQIFTSQVVGGISRYFAELLRHRDALGNGLQVELRLPVTVNQYLDGSCGFTGHRATSSDADLRGKASRLAVYAFGSLPPRGSRSADLLHHTYYRTEALRLTPGVARVSTLYDMIPELYPELFPRGNPHRDKKRYFEASDLIISISEASAQEMLDVWPHLAGREIAVVPLGVSGTFMAPGPAFSTRRPFLLFVGNRAGYKNFSVVVKALKTAGGSLQEHALIAVGGGAFTRVEQAQLERLGLRERVRHLPASDSELASLYRGAAAFVFPSIHEGFGLPTLEALACGCPVLLSDTPVFHEVAGSAATYFDANSPESLLEALAVLDDPNTLKTQRDEGHKLALDRTWRVVAAATGEAYRRVL